MDWRKLISQSVGQEQLSDINTFIAYEDIDNRSAIDTFYDESRSIIGITPAQFDNDSWIGPLNTVALVSLTENYFRTILGNILKVCSTTRKNAADNNINFGSVLWHPQTLVERGAFEHVSFSDSKKIIEVSRKYVGVDLKALGLLPILDEYSKVCEIRHGIVHSGRYVAGKNALILDFPSSEKFVKITVGYGQFQSIASICTTLVISYNQKMFEVLCDRWATHWRQTQSWNPQQEKIMFKKVWDVFFSKIDKEKDIIAEKGTWIKCFNLIKAEYNIL